MRTYLQVALYFYYKEIRINYNKPLLPNQPTLFLGNHQNGLMDPLLIATRKGHFSYFLTRAAVFQKPWVSGFLNSLNMLPVYRVRDGWSNLSKNNDVFKRCTHLLHKGNSIVIFPEGSHDIKRRVRPLSKGFTRIIAETLTQYPNLNIQLVPVGFNYRDTLAFGGSVMLNFGMPLSTQNYRIPSDHESVSILKVDVHKALTILTAHIEDENYEVQLQKLERFNVNFLDPEKVNQCLNTNFKQCMVQATPKSNIMKGIAKIGLCISLFLPYGIWKIRLQPKIKEPEFVDTFRFGMVISLVPIFMFVMVLIIGLNFGWVYAFGYLATVLVLDVMAVKL